MVYLTSNDMVECSLIQENETIEVSDEELEMLKAADALKGHNKNDNVKDTICQLRNTLGKANNIISRLLDERDKLREKAQGAPAIKTELSKLKTELSELETSKELHEFELKTVIYEL